MKINGKIKIIIFIVLIFFIIGSVSTYFIFLRLQRKTNYELEIIIGTSSNNSYEIFLPIPLESEEDDVFNGNTSFFVKYNDSNSY